MTQKTIDRIIIGTSILAIIGGILTILTGYMSV